jgi:hypothetical protein
MVFLEILPQTRTLITDVFGNYVIQKVRNPLPQKKNDKCDLFINMLNS